MGFHPIIIAVDGGMKSHPTMLRGASAPHHARPAPQGGRDTPTLGPGAMLGEVRYA